MSRETKYIYYYNPSQEVFWARIGWSHALFNSDVQRTIEAISRIQFVNLEVHEGVWRIVTAAGAEELTSDRALFCHGGKWAVMPAGLEPRLHTGDDGHEFFVVEKPAAVLNRETGQFLADDHGLRTIEGHVIETEDVVWRPAGYSASMSTRLMYKLRTNAQPFDDWFWTGRN